VLAGIYDLFLLVAKVAGPLHRAESERVMGRE
jgi:hypothetical protein